MTDRQSRELIRIAIFTACREAGVPVTPRPIIASDPSGPAVPEPEPLAAIRVARSLEWAAGDAVRSHARAAREDGHGWAEIGTALGCKPGEDRPPVAESAFRVVASDLGRGPSFGWTCPSCLKTVLDDGPGLSPHDAEHGHAGGCTRFAEAVRAWEAQWEDEDV